MNIAVFIKKTTFHKGFGGLETQNKVLCEGLARTGHSVTVFSPAWELSGKKLAENVKYEFVDCVFRSLAGFSVFQKNNWENRSLEEFQIQHEKEKFDVVISQSSGGIGIIRNKEKLNIPVVTISHGTTMGEYNTILQSLKSPKDFLKLVPNTAYVLFNFFYRQREFINHSDKVVAVSNKVKEALVNETFVDGEKVEVVHNGIVPPEFNFQSDRKNTVLYVGQVHNAKGIGDLLEIAKMIDANFKIVGGGEHLEAFKALAKDIKNVEFTGKIPYEKVLDLMSTASIFVLPSKRVEGFPMTLVEAMFAKLPIVGSNMGGIPEAIDHENTGFVYESGNIDQLFEFVSRLVKDKDLAKNMGEKGYEKAKQEFTVDVMLGKYSKVLQEVQK